MPSTQQQNKRAIASTIISIVYKCKQALTHVALLCVLISASSVFAESDPEAFTTHKKEPSPVVKGSWTVVVLPDTQNYLTKKGAKPEILDVMMEWVAKEKKKRNIQMVVHVGDMTNSDNEEEWTMIHKVYEKLDNIVPYVVCEGNHDRKHGNLMNNYFKIGDNPLNKAIFGGWLEEGKLQNAYYLMEQNKIKYLFLALGENPDDRKRNLAWGNKIIKAHPEHRVFLTFHVYMSEDSRLLSKDGLPDPTGNPAYQQLVMPNQNVEFVTCGHFGSHKKGTGKGLKKYEGVLEFGHDLATGHRSDKTKGVTAHQILFNGQFLEHNNGRNGGDGWMLLMEFAPDNRSVKVKTYSPFLKTWRTGPEYEYTLNRN